MIDFWSDHLTLVTLDAAELDALGTAVPCLTLEGCLVCYPSYISKTPWGSARVFHLLP